MPIKSIFLMNNCSHVWSLVLMFSKFICGLMCVPEFNSLYGFNGKTILHSMERLHFLIHQQLMGIHIISTFPKYLYFYCFLKYV